MPAGTAIVLPTQPPEPPAAAVGFFDKLLS